MKARTLAPVHPARPRMYLMGFKIYPRVSEDHPDSSWMLQMGSLSQLSMTCTSRLLSFWNGQILSLHAVRRVGRERQLHLKVRALCGEVEKVFDVLVDTGAQVSLVNAALLPPECLTDSRKPVQAECGERPVHGGRHEGSGHWAAVCEPP